MNFVDLVTKARPQIKENSAKAYATSLKLLAPESAENLDFLLDTQSILEKLEKYKHTTRRNYLNAVIVVLKGVEGSEAALKEYEKVRDKYNEEYADQVQTHKKTDRQKEIWIDWPDYLEIVGRLQKDTRDLKSQQWSKKETQQFQDFLITLLYSKYPLRNDWSNTKVISKTEYNKLGEEEKKQGNYLVKHNTNKYFFVLNEYKTSKKYGEKNIEIDEDVLKPLRRWLRHNDTGYLLINSKGSPLNSNGITKTLNKIGLAERGKPFGSSILRHSYLSHKYGENQKEKEKDADLMGHSVATQEDYVKVD
eukprot:COSAG02_NODE_4479_length_5316_cov_1484.345218_4_plen_307_part_00